MLTDKQITELSKKMKFSLAGIYFKDELPRKLQYNKGYVINLQDGTDEEGNSNDGSHWTALQVNKYPNGKIEPIFFDPYGVPPSENIKKWVLNNCGKKLPYTEKDIQSLMNNACGWYCCAFLHYINVFEHRSKDLYEDVSLFLDYFDDLNKSIDWKKNEYILKMFFQSKDPSKRKDIEVISSTHNIDGQDIGKGMNLMKIPVDVNILG